MSSQEMSEEQLNAYVDDELSASDRARVLEALDHDAALQKRMAEIQQMRSLLRHAYEHPPLPPQAAKVASFWKDHKLAAGVLVVAGAVAGAYLHLLASNGPATQIAGTPKGVVIQVSEADPAKWNMALINASNVRKAYGDKGVAVEIVAYGPGLKMLRKDSAVAAGLEAAKKSGVKLLACGNTMTMTHTTRDELNRVVDIVPAGIVEIMERQQEGYAYVRP